MSNQTIFTYTPNYLELYCKPRQSRLIRKSSEGFNVLIAQILSTWLQCPITPVSL
jgi:hypothetical protein